MPDHPVCVHSFRLVDSTIFPLCSIPSPHKRTTGGFQRSKWQLQNSTNLVLLNRPEKLRTSFTGMKRYFSRRTLGLFSWLADLYCLENMKRRLAEVEAIHLALDVLLPCKLSRSVGSLFDLADERNVGPGKEQLSTQKLLLPLSLLSVWILAMALEKHHENRGILYPL